MELSAEQKQQLEAQKAQCPFCKIIAGEIPAQKVYEDDKVLAILDINPFKKGHTLVIPKEHYPIMPLLPKEDFQHLFDLIPEMSSRLREAMVVPDCYVYIANGAAAGQQAGHFMVHLIPSDAPIPQFSPAKEPVDQQAYDELQNVLSHNLPIMMRERSGLFPMQQQEQVSDDDRSARLAELLEENPDFKQTLIENPDVIRQGIKDNPSLQELFEGVDVDALSQKLKEAHTPDSTEPAPSQEPSQPVPQKAVEMSDEQLKAFINKKDKLRELLLEDIQTLQQAIPQQERLQEFFENTTAQEVLQRYTGSSDKQSLEDLAS